MQFTLQNEGRCGTQVSVEVAKAARVPSVNHADMASFIHIQNRAPVADWIGIVRVLAVVMPH